MNAQMLLANYEYNIENLQRRFKQGSITKEARDLALYMNTSWYHILVNFKDLAIVYPGTSKEYQHYNNRSEPLLYVIQYRCEEIPVYDDDYGQQEFAIIRGKCVSGGAYNEYAFVEFCCVLDYTLQQEYLEQ